MPLPQRPSLARHVAEALRDGLKRGLWQERLPGERDLCRHLNVSRPTLRAALVLLEKEGWLGSRPGQVRVIKHAASDAVKSHPPVVRLLVPFRLQEAPQFLFYWIDKLRALLPAAGCSLEIHSGSRWYVSRPDKRLDELVRQAPASTWVLARTTEPMQRWFQRREVPCIVAGSCHPGIELPSVDFDHRSMARHAAHQLLARGHRRLALLIQTPELAGDLESEAGFESAVAAAGVADVSAVKVRHDGTLADVRRCLDRLLRLRHSPTGFFVLRSTSALAVASELIRRGIRLPEDSALISRDSDPFLGYFSPELARYSADPDLFARRLAAIVIKLAKDGTLPRRDTRLIPDFVKGETLGEAPMKMRPG